MLCRGNRRFIGVRLKEMPPASLGEEAKLRGVNLGKTAENTAGVWLLDPDESTRRVTERLLNRQGLQVVTCATMRAFFAQYRTGRAQCLVLEYALPDGDGLALQKELAAMGDLLPLIFLTAHNDVPAAVSALKNGATDYLLKPLDAPALVDAIQGAIARARRYRLLQESAVASRRLLSLTDREREVLDLVVGGLSTKQISAKLHRVEKTVEFHRQNIMRKLGATNVAHLVRLVTTADHAMSQRNGHTPHSASSTRGHS